MTFTPGPWHVEPAGEAHGTHVFAAKPQGSASDGDVITVADFIENDANAHLIAAAPDFYAAVAKFLTVWPEVEKRINGAILMATIHGASYSGPQLDIESLRAALAKAEGR